MTEIQNVSIGTELKVCLLIPSVLLHFLRGNMPSVIFKIKIIQY